MKGCVNSFSTHCILFSRPSVFCEQYWWCHAPSICGRCMRMLRDSLVPCTLDPLSSRHQTDAEHRRHVALPPMQALRDSEKQYEKACAEARLLPSPVS